MAEPNPNPTYITDAIWALWTDAEANIPGVRLGGIYANKSGYHNTVNSNKKSWPGNYSIRLPLDLTQPDNKARALDLTMDTAQMILRTGYLRASALDPVDDRLGSLREFYGTLDGVNVFGLIKDTVDGPWRSATSDTSHLWHIHESIFTTFCADAAALAGVASVVRGQSWHDWINGGEDMAFGDIQTQQLKIIYNAITQGILDGNATVDASPYFSPEQPMEMNATLEKILAKLESPTPVEVDADAVAQALIDNEEFLAALAKAVNDDAAARLAD